MRRAGCRPQRGVGHVEHEHTLIHAPTYTYPPPTTHTQPYTHHTLPNRILMVDGDHRVAILARKDIQDGEELFYNYNYEKRVGARPCGGPGTRPPPPH